MQGHVVHINIKDFQQRKKCDESIIHLYRTTKKNIYYSGGKYYSLNLNKYLHFFSSSKKKILLKKLFLFNSKHKQGQI